MSGASGQNTKSSKIERIRNSQLAMQADIESIDVCIRRDLAAREKDSAAIAALTATNTLLAQVAHNLEAENARLRKYLGSVLFARRQRDAVTVFNETFPFLAIPTLEPQWGNSGTLEARDPPPTCTCPPGECRGSVIGLYRCRHCRVQA